MLSRTNNRTKRAFESAEKVVIQATRGRKLDIQKPPVLQSGGHFHALAYHRLEPVYGDVTKFGCIISVKN